MNKHFPHILWVFPLLTFIVLRMGMEFNGLYGQDAHEYYRYGKAVFDFFTERSTPGDFHWPVIYPFLGAGLAAGIRNAGLAMQLLSVLAFSGTGGLLFVMLQRLYAASRTEAAIFVLLAFLLSPLTFNAGFLVMSDMLATFFVMLAAYALLSIKESFSGYSFLLFVFAAALAVMTRYAAGIVLLPLAFMAGEVAVKNKAWHLLLPAILLTSLACLPFILLQGREADQLLEAGYFRAWSPMNYFRRSLEAPAGHFTYPLPNLAYAFYAVFHPGYLFFGGILVFGIKKADFSSGYMKALMASVLLYALFIAAFPFQNKRFLLLTFPLLLLLLFPAFQRIGKRLNMPKMRSLALAGILLGQLVLIGYVFTPLYRLNRLEQDVAKTLKQYPNKVLYAFWMDGALKSYGVKQEIRNLWEEEYKDFEPGALVLFNEEKFAEQWKGRNPMLNWGKLSRQHELDTLDTWEGGWGLFRIMNNE